MATSGSLSVRRSTLGLRAEKDWYHEMWHVACACSPKLNMCGGYVPTADSVDPVESDEGCCPECLQVWQSTGCGRCGCNSENPCNGCQQASAD